MYALFARWKMSLNYWSCEILPNICGWRAARGAAAFHDFSAQRSFGNELEDAAGKHRRSPQDKCGVFLCRQFKGKLLRESAASFTLIPSGKLLSSIDWEQDGTPLFTGWPLDWIAGHDATTCEVKQVAGLPGNGPVCWSPADGGYITPAGWKRAQSENINRGGRRAARQFERPSK